MKKLANLLCLFGTLLLVAMAGLHGSGFFEIKAAIEASDTSDFLKEILPPLFIHPSFHLLGLAGFGLLSIWLKGGAKAVLTLVAVLILVDALLAFYLGALIPGILLAVASGLFFTAGRLRNLNA